MIGYCQQPVVRLSVRLSVTLCIVALTVGVRGKQLYHRVPSIKVPICPFWHFWSRMHSLHIKCTTKKRSAPKSQYTRDGVCRDASRHSAIRCDRRYVCRHCRLQCTCVRAEVCGLRIFTGYDRLSQQQLSFLLIPCSTSDYGRLTDFKMPAAAILNLLPVSIFVIWSSMGIACGCL